MLEDEAVEVVGTDAGLVIVGLDMLNEGIGYVEVIIVVGLADAAVRIAGFGLGDQLTKRRSTI